MGKCRNGTDTALHHGPAGWKSCYRGNGLYMAEQGNFTVPILNLNLNPKGFEKVAKR
jgi:hypothetical protein